MDAYDIIKWREMYFGPNRVAAAKALNIAPNSLRYYEEGKRAIPKYIPLVCAAVAAGLKPWELPAELAAEKKANPVITPAAAPRGRKKQWIKVPVEEANQ